MDHYTHLETSRFKVKNPEKFKEEVKQFICGEDVDLVVDKDGFVLYACNATHLGYEEEDVVDPIGKFIQDHMTPDQIIRLTYLSSSSKNTDLHPALVVVTAGGITSMNAKELFGLVESKHYPKFMIIKEPYYDQTTKTWLHQDTTCTIVGEQKDNYLVEAPEGIVICPRRFFNE